MESVLAILMQSLIVCVILLVVYTLIAPRRTKTYAQRLADMYVAGRTRQIAKEKEINLDVEYTKFLLDEKKVRLKTSSLGTMLEEELSEELIKDFDKKQGKKEKE